MTIIREISRLVPIFLLVLAVAVVARLVANSGVNNTSRQSAEIISFEWADNIIKNITNIEEILDGKEIADEQILSNMSLLQPKEIVAYRIIDNSSIVRLELTSKKMEFSNKPMLGKKIDLPFNVVNANGKHHKLIRIEEGGRIRNGFINIIPLIKNDKKIGYIQIFYLETSIFEKFRSQFSDITFRFIILMLAAFLLPAILYLRRTAQLERASKHLRYSAEYDDLTGALNRGAFTRLIDRELKIAAQRGYSLAIHYIDLDRFKEINDTRGHEAGDEILAQTADRLRKLLDPRDGLARIGGDEFVIYQPYFVGSSCKAGEKAKQIIESLNEPFIVKNIETRIGASVGTSHFPKDGKEIDELLRTADLALYRAKQLGRSRAIEFDKSMEEERQSRQEIEQLLRAALKDNLFYLDFQPFYDIDTNMLRGFEALLRINDKNGKPISPAIFIPIAEDNNLISEIGAWVLREACNIAKNWPKHIIVSVNLSPKQFHTHNMPKLVEEVLKSSGLSAKQLELEVTESLLIADPNKVLQELNAIKQLGVSIALDDFGTGYSSLSYLWQFPFNKLKVDKSFISKLDKDGSKSHEILSTIIALGKIMDMQVTAEGVETPEQAKQLHKFNCDLVQGFLFSRPLNMVDVAAEIIKSAKIEKGRKQLYESKKATL